MTVALTRRAALLSAAAATVALSSVASAADAKLRLSIATGGTGGVFYPYGGGLARVLSRRVPGVQATAEVTGGSVDNIKLIVSGNADLGFSTIDSALDALHGAGAYADTGPQKIAALAVLYDSFVHVVANGSAKIAKVADLKGRRVSVGSAGSSTEEIADRILLAAGLDPKKDITRDNLSVAESASALKDGKIDAFLWVGGLPTAAVTDIVTTANIKITFVPTGDLLAKLNAKQPGLYRAMTLPKAVYAGTPADVPGVGVSNILFVAESTPAATVTKILGGIFDNLAEVQKIHPEAAKLTLAGAAAKSSLPFHPAALAFYKARGALK